MSDVNANLAQEVVKRVTSRARDMAKQIAQNVGSPVDASKLNRAEIVRLWNLQNPQANLLEAQQMVMAGQHSQAMDLMYPWRNKLIGQGSPQQRVDRAALFARWASGQDETST